MQGVSPENMPLTITELEKAVKEAEAKGNVGARSHISQYWQLVDLYLQNNDTTKAYETIIKALALDPWNYKYQKIAADIEIKNGETEKAYNRLNFITNNLKTLASIYNESVKAKKSINMNKLPEVPLCLPGYYVYIATFPNLNSTVVDALSAKISEEYGIEVKTINVGAAESTVNIRDKQEDLYNQVITDVKSRFSDDKINNFLKQLGLTADDLKTKKGKRIFVYNIMTQSSTGQEQWKLIEATKAQYSGNALINQLKESFANYNTDPHCFGVLGVTSQDIYENNYNFLFGWAQKKWGVISYARFLLDEPTAAQFRKRVEMQALSSVGFVIGIPRCTEVNCARAYPNSLAEMDKKTDDLGPECIGNLRKLYATLEK
jgi:predicted Zn-dependent protease